MALLKDLKVTITPKFDPKEIPKFTRDLQKGLSKVKILTRGASRIAAGTGRAVTGFNQGLQLVKVLTDVMRKNTAMIERTLGPANKIAKVAKATGMTPGQIQSLNFAFQGGVGGTGTGADTTMQMLESFVSKATTEGRLKDGISAGNQMIHALEHIASVTSLKEQMELTEHYFGMILRKGEGVSDMVSNLPKMKETIAQTYGKYGSDGKYNYTQSEYSDGLTKGEDTASKTGNLREQTLITQAMIAAQRELLQVVEKDLKHRSDIANRRLDSANAGSMLTSNKVANNLEENITRVIEKIGDRIAKKFGTTEAIESFTDKVLDGIDHIFNTLDAIHQIMASMAGFSILGPKGLHSKDNAGRGTFVDKFHGKKKSESIEGWGDRIEGEGRTKLNHLFKEGVSNLTAQEIKNRFNEMTPSEKAYFSTEINRITGNQSIYNEAREKQGLRKVKSRIQTSGGIVIDQEQFTPDKTGRGYITSTRFNVQNNVPNN